MSHTIPSRDISIEDKKHFREKVLQIAVIRGKHLGLWEEPTVRHRDLGPEDVGLVTWATPPLVGGSYTTWINFTVSPHQIICIFKALQLSEEPTVTTLRFWRGPKASTIGIQELEACYGGLPTLKNLRKILMSREGKEALNRLAGREESVSPDLIGTPMEAYFSEPYMFEPNYIHVIEVKARKDSNGDYLVLGGFVLEPAGMTIE